MNAGWQGGEGDRIGLCCPLIAELEKKKTENKTQDAFFLDEVQ